MPSPGGRKGNLDGHADSRRLTLALAEAGGCAGVDALSGLSDASLDLDSSDGSVKAEFGMADSQIRFLPERRGIAPRMVPDRETPRRRTLRALTLPIALLLLWEAAGRAGLLAP